MEELVKGIRRFDHRSIAKAVSLVERRDNSLRELFGMLDDDIGRACRIGFTGPPGAGKSTLISKIVGLLSEGDKKVSILAVDPTSPFTGGALLGDRVRMGELGEKIFIRSMATRGALGGIATTTMDAADILDAAGSDYIIIETVGVGQQEIEVAKFTDCVILVLSPESGDSVQMLKAGILEAADIIVVNKSDRPNADKILIEIESSMGLTYKKGTIIIKTAATKDQGLKNLVGTIVSFIDESKKADRFMERREKVLQNRLKYSCDERLYKRLREKKGFDERLEKSARIILEKKGNIYSEVAAILEEFYGANG